MKCHLRGHHSNPPGQDEGIDGIVAGIEIQDPPDSVEVPDLKFEERNSWVT